jgi:hypothetical protein
MKVFVWANCQGQAVSQFLPLLSGRGDKMEVRSIENYIAMREGESAIPAIRQAAGEADILIYQPLDAEHGFFSTEPSVADSARNCVRPECTAISFPYIFNNGLWPCFEEGTRVHNASGLTDLFELGTSLDEVQEMYSAGKLHFRIKERTAQSLQILRDREQSLDVKVADFVEAHLWSHEIFLTQNHPSSLALIEAVRQMCRLLFGVLHREPDLSAYKIGPNFTNLPGYYPIDRYCIEEGGVTYVEAPEEGADLFYRNVIRVCHAHWLASKVQD